MFEWTGSLTIVSWFLTSPQHAPALSKRSIITACFQNLRSLAHCTWKRQKWVELRRQLGKSFCFAHLFGLKHCFSNSLNLRPQQAMNFPLAFYMQCLLCMFLIIVFSLPLIIFDVDYYPLNGFYNSLMCFSLKFEEHLLGAWIQLETICMNVTKCIF